VYAHVKAIEVSIWGRHVGTIAPKTLTHYRFEYDPEFLSSGIEIAPFELPLRPGEFAFPGRPVSAFYGMPAVFADSIPDSFGNSVIDEWMERQGVFSSSVTPLDRLAYVGSRAMGALEYRPTRGPRHEQNLALRMKRVIDESRLVLSKKLDERSGSSALREIFRVGTSAGGAQSKAIVGWNRETNKFCLPYGELPPGYEHWIVKITPTERPYSGLAEYRTYEKARVCGIDISESCLYEVDGIQHFMTRRFDREGGRRHHLLTFRAMRTLPPDVSLEMNSYGQLFATIVELKMGYEALEEMFRRMAFNVYADETDDHAKNFSFLLKEGGRWQLAPAYDLTGGVPSEAPSDDARRQWTNCHALSINGKQSDITDDDLLSVAERYGIGTAPRVLSEVKAVFR
jgi:serine/threonine-protein kinase HipA